MLQRQIASCVLENFFENICLRNRILSLQQVAKNQIGLNLCELLQRQNSVAATKIFTKILPVHMERFIATMCHLVSTNLNEVDVKIQKGPHLPAILSW